MTDPSFKTEKTYWVQVEGDITPKAITELCSGTIIITHKGNKHKVSKAKCKKMDPPKVQDRIPPIRSRKAIPTSWIELKITEGKNRQVRKMTAAVGFPTLRLIRFSVHEYTIDRLNTGEVLPFLPIN